MAVYGFALLTACGGNSARPELVVLKYATHPALDELESSFLASFNRAHPDFKVTRLNANGSAQMASQLAESAINSKPRLIVTLATPATQAVARAKSEVSFVYAAVADPDGAGVITERSTGIQNAGEPLVREALLDIRLLLPNVKRIGTIYNPAEQNSIFVQAILRRLCTEFGLTLVARTSSDPKDLPALIEQMAPEIEALYCTNDNNVNKGVLSVATACSALKLPFVIGELNAVPKGALFGVGVEYVSMGIRLSDLVTRVLATGPGQKLPDPEGPPPPQLLLNDEVADGLKIAFPAEMRTKSK